MYGAPRSSDRSGSHKDVSKEKVRYVYVFHCDSRISKVLFVFVKTPWDGWGELCNVLYSATCEFSEIEE